MSDSNDTPKDTPTLSTHLSQHERIELERMLRENHVEDTTAKIRTLKHSKPIRECLVLIERMKREYPRIYQNNYAQFEQMVQSRGGAWLWSNYTNIYNKLMKNQINPQVVFSMVEVLEQIEQGKLDQHEASVVVGKLLKHIFVDGAIHQDGKPGKKATKKSRPPPVDISWQQYKEKYGMQ